MIHVHIHNASPSAIRAVRAFKYSVSQPWKDSLPRGAKTTLKAGKHYVAVLSHNQVGTIPSLKTR